jgi:hypothetical protein
LVPEGALPMETDMKKTGFVVVALTAIVALSACTGR